MVAFLGGVPVPALVMMLACFVAVLGMSATGAVWTELLLQRACERQRLPFPSTASPPSPGDDLG